MSDPDPDRLDSRSRLDATPTSTSGPIAVAAVVGLLLVPITALYNGAGDVTLVFPWAFVNTTPIDSEQAVHVYTVVEYFSTPGQSFERLPGSLQAWPLALGLYLLAAASAVGGWVFDREDRRVTAGLLVLAGIASLWVTVGVSSRLATTPNSNPSTVLPIGAVVTLAVVVWFYRDGLRRLPGSE